MSALPPLGHESKSVAETPERLEDVEDVSPPPVPPADGPGEDDILYGDQDDPQTLIEPTISPVATRLTLPKTPAAEKAAAIEHLPGGGLFDVAIAEDPPSPPAETDAPALVEGPSEPTRPLAEDTPVAPGSRHRPQPLELPSPWTAGPKLLVKTPEANKPALAGVFGTQARHRRSSSVGAEALKRLSKAFPNLSIPAHLMPNLSTPSFFSSSSSQSSSHVVASQNADDQLESSRVNTLVPSHEFSGPRHASTAPPKSQLHLHSGPGTVKASDPRRSSVQSINSLGLRRTTSEESLLYNSLSRVSSYGDDDRFVNVREQVNSRLKAIKDSWDPPFKLPQMPSILPSPVKKQFSNSEIGLEPTRSASVGRTHRTARDANSILDAVLETLTGDIVIMGGYRGSILRSAEPPHRQLWVPVKVGLNIRKVNLEVGLDPEDEENMEKTIFPSGMLQNIGPVDISRRLFKKLRDCENARTGKLRVHDYGYDWRLSPHLLSRKLVEFLEGLPSNHGPSKQGALVIAHSLGGIITRHAVNQRPELFSGVLYAGSPQRCINILGPIRNGDAVMLNEKVLTAQVNFSLRTTFVFLPEDGFCFLDKNDPRKEYRIDFYDINDWIRYRLSPCVSDGALPPLSPRTGTFGSRSLLNLSDNLPNLPFRSRSVSDGKKVIEAARSVSTKDRTLAPQMDSTADGSAPQQQQSVTRTPAARARAVEYLTRTLAETKRFRAECAHREAHAAANAYPPFSVIYGKDTPTVYAARVAGREGIACADAYDDLVFRSGDGVVLAREAMLPEGYEVVKGGRVSSDKGHISLLGDLPAVGRALEAIVRGRRKGIGIGVRERE